MVAKARGFLNTLTFSFLTNAKFPWPTELEISQISPDNGLIAPLPVIPSTYLFMPLTSHFQYT